MTKFVKRVVAAAAVGLALTAGALAVESPSGASDKPSPQAWVDTFSW